MTIEVPDGTHYGWPCCACFSPTGPAATVGTPEFFPRPMIEQPASTSKVKAHGSDAKRSLSWRRVSGLGPRHQDGGRRYRPTVDRLRDPSLVPIVRRSQPHRQEECSRTTLATAAIARVKDPETPVPRVTVAAVSRPASSRLTNSAATAASDRRTCSNAISPTSGRGRRQLVRTSATPWARRPAPASPRRAVVAG